MSDGGGVIVGLYLLEVEVVGWVERVPVTQLHEDGVEQISVRWHNASSARQSLVIRFRLLGTA